MEIKAINKFKGSDISSLISEISEDSLETLSEPKRKLIGFLKQLGGDKRSG